MPTTVTKKCMSKVKDERGRYMEEEEDQAQHAAFSQGFL